MICLPPQGTPPQNTAAGTAHSAHSTQPALPPHHATPRVDDNTPADAPPHSYGLCSPLSEGHDPGSAQRHVVGESTAVEAVNNMQSMAQGTGRESGPQGPHKAAHTEGRGTHTGNTQTRGESRTWPAVGSSAPSVPQPPPAPPPPPHPEERDQAL